MWRHSAPATCGIIQREIAAASDAPLLSLVLKYFLMYSFEYFSNVKHCRFIIVTANSHCKSTLYALVDWWMVWKMRNWVTLLWRHWAICIESYVYIPANHAWGGCGTVGGWASCLQVLGKSKHVQVISSG